MNDLYKRQSEYRQRKRRNGFFYMGVWVPIELKDEIRKLINERIDLYNQPDKQ